jgi:hypothetical protein
LRDLTEEEIDRLLDEIFASWLKKEREMANPDHLPYDPRKGF